MNYSVANKKYKKYEKLLREDSKNKLFKRKLGKYDLLRHDLDQNDEMNGGGKKSKSKKGKVKGFRVMGGGNIDFALEPTKTENQVLGQKNKFIVESQEVIKQVTEKLNNMPKCEQEVEKAKSLDEKTKELAELQTAFKKLQEEHGAQGSFKEKYEALEKKVEEELGRLRADVTKLQGDKETLQKNAEKYVNTLSDANKETVAGLEQIITEYHASMENLKSNLGIKTD